MKKEKGFTLVEAIVAPFIGGLMLMAIYAAVNRRKPHRRELKEESPLSRMRAALWN